MDDVCRRWKKLEEQMPALSGGSGAAFQAPITTSDLVSSLNSQQQSTDVDI